MSLVNSKAGLQMVETITRYLPRITVCLEQLAKQDGTFKDIIKLADEMDIRKQEANNLKFQIDELKAKVKEHDASGFKTTIGIAKEYNKMSDRINQETANSAKDILELLNRVCRLETIIEERK